MPLQKNGRRQSGIPSSKSHLSLGNLADPETLAENTGSVGNMSSQNNLSPRKGKSNKLLAGASEDMLNSPSPNTASTPNIESAQVMSPSPNCESSPMEEDLELDFAEILALDPTDIKKSTNNLDKTSNNSESIPKSASSASMSFRKKSSLKVDLFGGPLGYKRGSGSVVESSCKLTGNMISVLDGNSDIKLVTEKIILEEIPLENCCTKIDFNSTENSFIVECVKGEFGFVAPSYHRLVVFIKQDTMGRLYQYSVCQNQNFQQIKAQDC
jgi:hypothetical protein